MNSKLITIGFTILFLFTNCQDFLDKEPSTSVLPDKALESVEGINTAILGIYGHFQSRDIYAARLPLNAGGVKADLLKARTEGSDRFVNDYAYRITEDQNATGNYIWSRGYKIINQCNVVLDAAMKLTQSDEIDPLIAELKAIRGMVYFDLTRVFGRPYTENNGASMGVPVVTSPVSSSNKPARNTVKECYAQIVSDLSSSLSKLKDASNGTDHHRMNRWAAKTLLARAYLYQGDYANALVQAEETISGAKNKGYRLANKTEYKEMWAKETSPEYFFKIYFAEGAETSGIDGAAYLMAPQPQGTYQVTLTQKAIDLLSQDPSDVRNTIVSIDADNNGWLKKYPGPDGDINKIRESDMPIVRMAETYLIASEASLMMNNKTKAAEYLNTLRSARTNNTSPITEAQITIEEILDERAKELVSEGHRFFDLTRNGKTIHRKSGASTFIGKEEEISPDDYRVVYPIPLSEILANPNIVQNDNY